MRGCAYLMHSHRTQLGDLLAQSFLNYSDRVVQVDWIVAVMGATATVARQARALLRVRTTTGRLLSGGTKLYTQTSPRAILAEYCHFPAHNKESSHNPLPGNPSMTEAVRSVTLPAPPSDFSLLCRTAFAQGRQAAPQSGAKQQQTSGK